MSVGTCPSGNPDNNLGDLKLELARRWSEPDHELFFEMVQSELRPRICAHLQNHFHLTVQDAEDCVSHVQIGLIQSAPSISDPYQYMWTGCRNQAISQWRQKKNAASITEYENLFAAPPIFMDGEKGRVNRAFGTQRGFHTPSPSREGSSGTALAIPDTAAITDAAIRFVEGVSEGVEADRQWAAEVLEAAISQLSPALRLVVSHLQVNGPNYDSKDALSDLGMKEKTFKAYKSKAYAQLRTLIPDEMHRRGIFYRRYTEPDVGFKQDALPPTAEEDDWTASDMFTVDE
jgi:DNA-directed RNA polymerase specialized sigma24 family protein